LFIIVLFSIAQLLYFLQRKKYGGAYTEGATPVPAPERLRAWGIGWRS